MLLFYWGNGLFGAIFKKDSPVLRAVLHLFHDGICVCYVIHPNVSSALSYLGVMFGWGALSLDQ